MKVTGKHWLALILMAVTTLVASVTSVAETSEPATTQDTPSKLEFKQENTDASGALYKSVGLLVLLAVVGYGIVQVYSRRRFGPVTTDASKAISVQEKKILGPGLVSYLVEVDGRKLLVIQDKTSHSVTDVSSKNCEVE